MTDLQELFRTVDEFPPEDFKRLYEYVTQHRRVVQWWVVPPENLAKIAEVLRPVQEEVAQMTDEEINAAIDEAIAEVCRERAVHRHA